MTTTTGLVLLGILVALLLVIRQILRLHRICHMLGECLRDTNVRMLSIEQHINEEKRDG